MKKLFLGIMILGSFSIFAADELEVVIKGRTAAEIYAHLSRDNNIEMDRQVLDGTVDRSVRTKYMRCTYDGSENEYSCTTYIDTDGENLKVFMKN
jgi:hypothetical protein